MMDTASHMEGMTILQCELCQNGTLCIQSGIRLVLGRSRVSAGHSSHSKFIKDYVADIYIVADAEGNEMVLKLHR